MINSDMQRVIDNKNRVIKKQKICIALLSILVCALSVSLLYAILRLHNGYKERNFYGIIIEENLN